MPFLNIFFWLLIGVAIGWGYRYVQEPTIANSAALRQQDDTQQRQAFESVEEPVARRDSASHTTPEPSAIKGVAAPREDVDPLALLPKFIEQDRTEAARGLLEKFLQESNDPQAWLLLAQLEYTEGNFRDALTASIFVASHDTEYRYTAEAETLFKNSKQQYFSELDAAQNWQGMVQLLVLLAENGLDTPEDTYGLAKALYHLHRYDEALVELGKILYDRQWGFQAQRLQKQVRQMLDLRGQAKVIDLRSRNGNYLVKVVINGKHPSVLVVDTGSPYTILKNIFAQNAGIEISSDSKRMNLTGISNSAVEANQIILSSIDVSGVVLYEFTATVGDILPKSKVDGILGLDFLNKFSFSITPNHQLFFNVPP